MNEDEIDARKRELTQPLDLEALAADGTLTKAGAWWLVANIHKLPGHVAAQVREVKTEGGRSFVKFRATRAKR